MSYFILRSYPSRQPIWAFQGKRTINANQYDVLQRYHKENQLGEGTNICALWWVNRRQQAHRVTETARSKLSSEKRYQPFASTKSLNRRGHT